MSLPEAGDETRSVRPVLRTVLIVTIAVLTAAALVAVGVVAGRAGAPESVRGAPDVASDRQPTGTDEDALDTYRDGAAGFEIAHPTDWSRLESADPQVRLVVTPDGENSALVRVVELDFDVGDEERSTLRELTDDLVGASETTRVLVGPEPIELAGARGYYYLYTFVDEASGRRGLHGHYFLFHGRRMYALVFQALPEDEFERLAPLFDTMAESFRLEAR